MKNVLRRSCSTDWPVLNASMFGDDGSTITITVLSFGAHADLTSFSVGPACGPNRVNTRSRQSVRLITSTVRDDHQVAQWVSQCL